MGEADSDETTRQIRLQAVERFALLLTEAGMPRMASRVFAYLVVDEADGFTAGELAQALSVSPAAISGAVRYLTQARVIVRDRPVGARRDIYRLHDDQWAEMTLERVDFMRHWEALLSETIELIGPDRAGRSLQEARAFVAFMREEYPAMLERWRRYKRALALPDGPRPAPTA